MGRVYCLYERCPRLMSRFLKVYALIGLLVLPGVTTAVRPAANTDLSLARLRSENITFDYILANTECDIGTGLYKLVELSTQVDAFIGPACDSICEPAGLLAGKWNKPMISYACASEYLMDRQLYPTFARTSPLYTNAEHFLIDIMHHFGWKRATIVEGSDVIWRETAGHLQEDFSRYGLVGEILSIPTQDPHATLEKHLLDNAQETKIFILCAYGQDVMYVMCAAETAGLLNGEYAFISIDFAYMIKVPPVGRPCKMEHDLDGMLDMTILIDDTASDYQMFVRNLVKVTGTPHGQEVGIHAGMLYDAVYVYTKALDDAIGLGFNESHGVEIVRQCIVDSTFDGITGKVHIDENGTRRVNFSLHNIHNGIYSFVANFFVDTQLTTMFSPIVWPGNTLVPPLGRPVCGWNSEYCEEINDYVAVVVAVVAVFSLIILALIGFMIYFYRNKKREELLESMSWKIPYSDLTFRTMKGKRMGSSNKTLSQHTLSTRNMSDSGTLATSHGSMDSNMSRTRHQRFIQTAAYKEHILAVRPIQKPYTAVTQALITEMNAIRSLKHRNLNPLIGACIEPMKTCLLSVYCTRGSLQDVLENDEIKLDQIFKISFATDVAKVYILLRLKKKETPPFRPEVSAEDDSVSALDDLMRMCWEEVAIFRPKFTSILDTLKKANQGKNISLVDQMVHMMSKYADHLEELVQERTEQLEVEQNRTEELLCRMLPRSIANDLKHGKVVVPETYDSVTIFFSDIVGFTVLASNSSPIQVVNFLNDLYTCFDKILETYDVYKVETIGDAYMVVSGMPVRNYGKHASEIATMALDLLSSVTTFKIRHQPEKQLELRIGIHTGPVAVGVVGVRMPRYCLFGDTVNYASRMESSGMSLRIHVSPECKEQLDKLDVFFFECRGEVQLKGKGTVTSYFLLGRQGFSKLLPDLQMVAPVEQHEFK